MPIEQSYSETSAPASGFSPATLPGEGQSPNKMQGHWVLARAGKRVLRPGGIALTRRMLDALAICPDDDVVEFAPGMGATARIVSGLHPQSYCAVERDPAAAARMRRNFSGPANRVVMARAEESGLHDECATVVYSEALLSMQTPQQKNKIIGEARRLLRPGGRYGIQELCLPDGIADSVRKELEAAMSREIHVGVQPLCQCEWVRLFEENDLKVRWTGTAPMHLLEPRRLLSDEGVGGAMRMVFHVAANPALGGRILAMRRLFHTYGRYLGAISLVGERGPSQSALPQ